MAIKCGKKTFGVLLINKLLQIISHTFINETITYVHFPIQIKTNRIALFFLIIKFNLLHSTPTRSIDTEI